MLLKRFILCVSLMVFSVQGTGALSLLHNFSAHFDASEKVTAAFGGCNDAHEGSTNAPPGDEPDDPASEDPDCDLCLVFQSITPIPVTHSAILISDGGSVELVDSDRGVHFVRSAPSPRSTRAPPALCV